ncbi:MAG: hypothetical protein M3R15_26890 [Acidobacteriota bacterium]|nr:hypothetical protein [Acidobacteriota bacterium]
MIGRNAVQTYFNADGTQQVVIFERADDSLGFEELRFGSDERDWFPCGCYSASFTDSIEMAVREARARVKWLAEAED